MQIRREIEVLLGGESLDFLIFSSDMLKQQESMECYSYEKYLHFYDKTRNKKIKALSKSKANQVHQLYGRFMMLMHDFCCAFSSKQKENEVYLSSIKALMHDKYTDIVAEYRFHENLVNCSSSMKQLTGQNTSLSTVYSDVFLRTLSQRMKAILKIVHQKK